MKDKQNPLLCLAILCLFAKTRRIERKKERKKERKNNQKKERKKKERKKKRKKERKINLPCFPKEGLSQS